MKEVRIPEDRLGVIIGEEGETKEEFQEVTGCSLEIEGNLVRVEGDPLEEMTARKAVKAVGRGFNPDKALKLVERDVDFHMVDISNYDQNSSRQNQLKGRVIGRDGETRRHLEKEAKVDISVYGSTVAVIGKSKNIEVVMESIKMLLNGSSHATAYGYLEKNQAKIQR